MAGCSPATCLFAKGGRSRSLNGTEGSRGARSRIVPQRSLLGALGHVGVTVRPDIEVRRS